MNGNSHRHGPGSVAAAALFLATLLPSGIAPAQSNQVTQVPSLATALFAPGDRVPLSEFALKASAALTLHVDPEILRWVTDHSSSVKIAILQPNGQVTTRPATAVDIQAGTVEFAGPEIGPSVVVCDLLLQDLTIVTHWKATLNTGRGGQQLGAHDGLKTYDYDPQTGELTESGGFLNGDPNWADPTGGQYSYASNVYAVFSDGSGVPDNEAVPAYERYVGESYATHAITPLAAIWLSDQSRLTTGYPVAHRSYPEAFQPGAPLGHRLENSLPVFQIVHCYLVAPPDDATIPGYEHSLATFLLPPGWKAQVIEGGYPILFNGFYDIHSSTFGTVGLSFLDTLATLHRHTPRPRNAVGLLWNGGGAAAATTFHRSAYTNAAQLFADAATLLYANPERMVFTGGSRGGTTALEMASNPYGYPYTAQFVQARDPQTLVGTTVTDLITPTYSLLEASVAGVTGYLDSWKPSWQEPGTGKSGRTVVLRNLFDTEDPAVVDTLYSIDSDLFRTSLLNEGSRVVLRLGTNDFSASYALEARYINHLQADGVPLLADIFYRFGHEPPTGTDPDDAALLDRVFEYDTSLATGVRHFATDPADYSSFVPISPPHVPLVFELPLVVGSTQTQTWATVGEPGSQIQIWARKMDPAWFPGDPPAFAGPPVLAYAGTLRAQPGETFAAGWQNLTLSLTTGFWWYEAKYSPDGDNVFETTLGQGDIAAPTLFAPQNAPVLLVVSNDVQGLDDLSRTGGLVNDREFLP